MPRRGPRTRPRRDDAEAISDERDDAEAISDGRDDAEVISDGRDDAEAISAAAATAALTDPSTPRGEAHHARLCAVAAELASRFDVAAAPLVDVAARAMQPELARAEEGAEGGEGAEGAHEKSAEVLARAPGFRAACACLLASPLTHAGLPRDALASFASPVAASACAAALRDVPGDTPEIFAIDTLLGTVTGWRAVQSAPGSAPGRRPGWRRRLARD